MEEQENQSGEIQSSGNSEEEESNSLSLVSEEVKKSVTDNDSGEMSDDSQSDGENESDSKSVESEDQSDDSEQ